MKNPDIYFTVTDYNPSYVGVVKQHHVEIVSGNMSKMKNMKVTFGVSPDDIAHTVGEDYLKGRYTNIVVISFYWQNIDIAQGLIREFRNEIEDAIEYVVSKVANKYPDTLIISTVARDVWSHGNAAYEFLGSDLYENLFERCGFRDISHRTHKDKTIPTLTMVYVENMGGNTIINNFEKFW